MPTTTATATKESIKTKAKDGKERAKAKEKAKEEKEKATDIRTTTCSTQEETTAKERTKENATEKESLPEKARDWRVPNYGMSTAGEEHTTRADDWWAQSGAYDQNWHSIGYSQNVNQPTQPASRPPQLYHIGGVQMHILSVGAASTLMRPLADDLLFPDEEVLHALQAHGRQDLTTS